MTSLPVPTIDHAIVNARTGLDETADLYRRLGFTLTPRGRAKPVRASNGDRRTCAQPARLRAPAAPCGTLAQPRAAIPGGSAAAGGWLAPAAAAGGAALIFAAGGAALIFKE